MTNMNGMNQEKQQMLNRALVIDLLRQEGVCSRAALSKITRLKGATITNIINDFMRCGLIIEDGIMDGVKGRRSIGIRINGQDYRVIGVMVTRTDYSVVLMGLSGEFFGIKKNAIPENTHIQTIVDKIKNDIHKLIDENKEYKVLAVCVAMPGPYKREKGEMVFVTNLIGWEGIPLYKTLQEGFDIPVFVENDANSGAYAQLWYYGKKSQLQDLIYIVAGQGIGCGMISGGKLLSGAIGIAGEMGHTTINFNGPFCECGNRGCLEKYCSEIVLEQKIRKRIESGEKTCLRKDFMFEELKEAININDALVIDEFKSVCNYLAIGIVNVINQINPALVIIGDSLSDISPTIMLEIINNRVKETIRPLIWESLKIEINTIKYNPILVGAGAIAAQKVFENPFEYVRGK